MRSNRSVSFDVNTLTFHSRLYIVLPTVFSFFDASYEVRYPLYILMRLQKITITKVRVPFMWQIVLLGKHVGYFKQTTLWHSSTCLQWVRCSVHPGWFPPHYVADRHSPLDKIQTHSGDGLYTERHSQARIELEFLPRCLLAVSCRSFHSRQMTQWSGGKANDLSSPTFHLNPNWTPLNST